MENGEQKRANQAYIKELIAAGKAKLSSKDNVPNRDGSCDSDNAAKLVLNLETRKSGRKRPRAYITRRNQAVMNDLTRDTEQADDNIGLDTTEVPFTISSRRVGGECDSSSGESIS